jgi:uncharacterized protein YndB with AHSA1/START domain
MFTIEGSELIDRPTDEVFAFVSDVRNDPQWHTDVLEARLLSGVDVREGATFTTKFKPVMGMTEGTGIVTLYQPPHRVVLDERMGRLAPTTTLTVEPSGAGSRVTRRVEMEPFGLLRLMTPFMGGAMRKRNAGFLANLKRVLEQG